MKCPRCGADSQVLETRTWEYGTTARRRECFNMHRFSTVEIYRPTYGSARQRVQTYAKSVSSWRKLWARNMDLYRNADKGWQYAVEKYNLSRASFFLIVAQMRKHFKRNR